MHSEESYQFLFNGAPCSVVIESKTVSKPSAATQLPNAPVVAAQAPWVTAQRIAHLPAR